MDLATDPNIDTAVNTDKSSYRSGKLEYPYTVMQSDRNSSKTDTFHKPTTYELHAYTSSDKMITFARNKYGRVGVFRIKIRSLVQKL